MRWVVAFVAGCGRIAFGDHPDGPGAAGDATADTPGDAHLACPPFAILCDDFEIQPDPKFSTSVVTGGSLAIDTAIPAHSGQFVVDMTVPTTGNGDGSYLTRPLAAQVTTGQLAARVWTLAPTAGRRFDGVLQLDDGSNYALVAVDNLGNWAVSEQSAVGLTDHLSTTPAVAGTWVCVELDYDLDARTIHLFIDDQPAVDAASDNPAPSFSNLDVGLIRAGPNGWALYSDDAVLATQHIGC